jgi:hypothetical protein
MHQASGSRPCVVNLGCIAGETLQSRRHFDDYAKAKVCQDCFHGVRKRNCNIEIDATVSLRSSDVLAVGGQKDHQWEHTCGTVRSRVEVAVEGSLGTS